MPDCAEKGSRIKREHSELMLSVLIDPISTSEWRRLLGSPSSTLKLEKVLIWLGEATENSPVAFDIVAN